MDATLVGFLERVAKFGEDNDARETARPKRMLNITRDTGRLLWILVRAMGRQPDTGGRHIQRVLHDVAGRCRALDGRPRHHP